MPEQFLKTFMMEKLTLFLLTRTFLLPFGSKDGNDCFDSGDKTEPAPDNTTDDKKPDGKTTEDHNGNQQTSGNNSSQVNSAVQTTPKQEEQAVAEVTVQEESFANVIEAGIRQKPEVKSCKPVKDNKDSSKCVREYQRKRYERNLFQVSGLVPAGIINGKDITGNVTAPIDLGLVVGTSDIPKQKVTALADGNETIQLSLNYDGVFGFEGILRLSLGTDHSGKIANLYYYNETNWV